MRLRWDLKTKFISLAIMLVVSTTVTTITVVSQQLTQALTESEYARLERSLRFIKAQLSGDIQQLVRDVRSLSSSRSISGLLEAESEGSANLLALIKQEEWMQSLRVLFTQTIQSNDLYFKARYLRVEDTDERQVLERIVIWQQGERTINLPRKELQDKTQRDYVQDGLKLAQGDILLSQLNLNREKGKISEPYIATLRAIAPVFYRDRLKGFVILSLDLTQLFEQAEALLSEEVPFYATNHEGFYLFHNDKEKIFTFEFPEKTQHTLLSDYRFSAPSNALQSFTQGEVADLNDQRFIATHLTVHTEYATADRHIHLFLFEPKEKVTQIARSINRSLITIGLIIAIITVIVGLLFIRTLAQPVTQLIRSIRAFGHDQTELELPIDRRDEIGILARSFEKMVKNITAKTNELNHEILVRRLVEERLLQREAALKQSNKELEKFAYVASHDLQEPLRKVQAFGDRLKKHNEHQLDDKGKDYIQRMQSAARRMSQLINDLLLYSRLNTSQQNFQFHELDLIVDIVISDLEIRIDECNVTINRQPLPKIYCEKSQIERLLQNIIGNALKFKREDIPPEIAIWSEESSEDHIDLHIKDNGIGIEHEYQERIFEVFQRLHSRAEYEGTGIGLAICRKIMDNHKGSIRVVSDLNQGAEFIITLPCNDGIFKEQINV